MKHIDKKHLYESIMRNISILVKKTLNESNDVNKDLSFHNYATITYDSATLKSLAKYMSNIRNNKILTADEEYDLANIILYSDNSKEVEQAKNILVEANLKFVVKVAKTYVGLGIPLEDLIQAGNEGLIEATEHFNPDEMKKTKFITLAVWYIRRNIITEVNKHKTGRGLPEQAAYLHRAIMRFKDKFYTEESRYPDIDEIYDGLNKNPKWAGKVTIDKILEVIDATTEDERLDAVYTNSEGDTTTLSDRTASNTFNSPDKSLDNEDLQKQLEKYITKLLGDKNAYVVLNRFGINGRREKQIWELADELNNTEVNINLILRNSLAKMKEDPTCKKFLKYI